MMILMLLEGPYGIDDIVPMFEIIKRAITVDTADDNEAILLWWIILHENKVQGTVKSQKRKIEQKKHTEERREREREKTKTFFK